ncbi:hypothetical protein KRX57_07615 [Weeksellaceae bacterium TAE3-ERU29]|nr:hypothetical protein [Weeksellaceae bacterium TAE3-ERU29]
MTNKEKDMILDFVSSEIPIESFYKEFPKYKECNFIINQYNEVISHRDRDTLSYLRMLPLPTENIEEIAIIYRKILSENWHIEHEDIVSLFQSTYNNDKENIHILLNALENIPDYLQEDEITKYSYIKKIIYAIGAQPQPESLLALEKLASETNDNKIKELALHQIGKRKK